MFKLNLPQLFNNSIRLSKKRRKISKWRGGHTANAFLLGLLLLAGFLAVQTKPARAFPEGLEVAPRLEGAAPPAKPALQTTTLSVSIVSSPLAMVAVSNPASGPRLFVVQAKVTNTGSEPATNVLVTLEDYADQAGWTLASGEDPERFTKTLAAGATYNAYWLATYPTTDGVSNPYSVTAEADNVTTPASDSATVTTDTANRVGNSNLSQTELDVQVGFEFTLAASFELGNNFDEALLVPAGNLDFDAGAYRLVSTEAHFYRIDNNATVLDVTDLVYVDSDAFTNLPNNVDVGVDVTFTFLALAPSNTQICPVGATYDGSNLKFDNDFCLDASQLAVNGELTIEMSKTASSPTIEQGDVMTYTIFYQNTFTQAVEGLWIWDTPPTGVTVRESSITPAKDTTESTADMIVWNIGSVPAGGQGTLQFAVDVDGEGATLANGTSLVNPAFLSINPERFTAQSIFTDTATTTVNAPNIALTKTDGQTTANPGDVFNYTINLNNVGAAAAQSLIVTDTLPSSDLIVLAGAANPPFTSKVGQTLVWNNLGSIAGGNNLQITIPVAVNSPIDSQTNVVNTVDAAYENSFGLTYEKTATDQTQIQAGSVETATLSVSKTATPEDSVLNVGDLVTYTVTITNEGPVASANAVTVIDDLPNGVICQSVSATVNPPTGCADPLVWTISSLGVGQTASLSIVVLLGPDTFEQSVINTIEVTGPNIDDIPPGDIEVCPDGSTPTGPDTCAPDSRPGPPGTTSVTVNKSAQDLNGSPLAVGDTIRYTIDVENTGGEIAFNLVVTDTLSTHVTCQSVSTDPAATPPLSCTNPVVWEIESLGKGETATMTIDVLIKPSGAGQSIVNSVTVSGDNIGGDETDDVCPDGSTPTGDTCGSSGIPDVVDVNVAVTKTSQDLNGGQLEIGDILRYTIQATHQGNPGDPVAFNIEIIDDLPNQVTCQAVSATKNPPVGCADPLKWKISTLAGGETATLTIDVSINQNAAGQSIINSLSVTGDNIVDVTNPPKVCPDGSAPVNNTCAITPEDPDAKGPPMLYLPIMVKN